MGGGMWEKLKNNPITREYLKDLGFKRELLRLQQDPASYHLGHMSGRIKDDRLKVVLGVLLGVGTDIGPEPTYDGDILFEPRPQATCYSSQDESKDESNDELGKKKEAALKEKEEGNRFYKQKKFNKAI